MAPEWKSYEPDPSPDPEVVPEPLPPEPAPRRRQVSVSVRNPSVLVIWLLIAVGAFGFVGWGAVALLDDDGGIQTLPGGGRPQTVTGFGEMLDDVRSETGSTMANEAVLYPGYGVVRVPFKPGDTREIAYRWDGTLSEFTKSTSDARPFDLEVVDESLLEGFCDVARAELVEDPGDCYLIISRPDQGLNKGWIDAHVSNEFSQGGYISFTLEGDEVLRRTW